MRDSGDSERLTVVIAAYNAQRTIADAVASALDAGAARVVVVDDGSTDETADRAQKAGADVLRQENTGAAIARARGGASVDSEFVVFLDADDLLVAPGVARSIEMLTEVPDAAAAGGRVVGFAPGQREGTLLPVTFPQVTVETLLTKGYSAWPPAAAVIRVAKLRAAETLEPAALRPRFAEDYEMLVRLARSGSILRHDVVAMRYEMSGGKSVRSAQSALKCKEQIREHYASAWGIEIQLMSTWRRRAAANKRIARANRQAGHRLRAGARLALAYAEGGLSFIEKPRTTGGAGQASVEVFEWAAGQDDNIGDSLLRRPSLADARARGTRLHVFHGESTRTFDTGLGLAPGDVSYRAFRPWLAAAARRGVRQPTLLIPNAGEVKVSRRGAARLASLWAVSLLPHVRVLWMGAGVPGDRTVWSVPYRLLARGARFATFRDADSVMLLGAGRTAPDWAFALGSPTSEWSGAALRSRAAFILRGDRREPSEEWLEWASHLAEAHRLTPTFVAQVRRDNDLAERLAIRTGGESVLFAETATHADHEVRVREVYRESVIAVGDRLHGLIVAATEGAIPLGWVESSGGKIARHFDVVDMPEVGRFEGKSAAQLPDITDGDLVRWSASLPRRVDGARSRIRDAQVIADEVVTPRTEK
ncbi:hypothetical protein BHE97_06970 [Aeromicrobium sp. PE09-221]|uniref:glycosyltransferase family A protein n=1 Tax=Aeromicrobium sp. PE09-221 TaxID=1898043 RepID=UPI000B3E6E87|nr:glycosyltransferase family A protein [Aeromicrobium sp. PE09-221]OUZ10497.1 hypothetical protein BHE97_06970 [Aeromicrobium sp. PE09-221]